MRAELFRELGGRRYPWVGPAHSLQETYYYVLLFRNSLKIIVAILYRCSALERRRSCQGGTVMAKNATFESLSDQIDERVAARMQTGHWSGVAIGIELDGAIHIQTHGFANLEHQVEVREETVFRIGSVTKQFTAALILKLQEMGKLSVDDEITRYLPDYPTGGRRVTVHHLLSHTSGIQSVTALASYWQRIREDLSPEAVLELFQNRPFRFEPGDDFEYSNSNFLLLGVIIEKVLGKPYSDCIGVT